MVVPQALLLEVFEAWQTENRRVYRPGTDWRISISQFAKDDLYKEEGMKLFCSCCDPDLVKDVKY